MMARHSRYSWWATAFTAALAGAAALATAQSATTQTPSFEVAAVKANKSGSGMVRLGFPPGGRFTAENAPLQMLIGLAYGDPRPLADFQIIGGPKWMASERFDVVAKAEGDLQPAPDGPPRIL